MTMDRAVIGLTLFMMGADALLDAILATPPAQWIPVWLYVASSALATLGYGYFAVRVWRHGIA